MQLSEMYGSTTGGLLIRPRSLRCSHDDHRDGAPRDAAAAGDDAHGGDGCRHLYFRTPRTKTCSVQALSMGDCSRLFGDN